MKLPTRLKAVLLVAALFSIAASCQATPAPRPMVSKEIKEATIHWTAVEHGITPMDSLTPQGDSKVVDEGDRIQASTRAVCVDIGVADEYGNQRVSCERWTAIYTGEFMVTVHGDGVIEAQRTTPSLEATDIEEVYRQYPRMKELVKKYLGLNDGAQFTLLYNIYSGYVFPDK